MDNDDFIKLILIALVCPLVLPLVIEEKKDEKDVHEAYNRYINDAEKGEKNGKD